MSKRAREREHDRERVRRDGPTRPVSAFAYGNDIVRLGVSLVPKWLSPAAACNFI